MMLASKYSRLFKQGTVVSPNEENYTLNKMFHPELKFIKFKDGSYLGTNSSDFELLKKTVSAEIAREKAFEKAKEAAAKDSKESRYEYISLVLSKYSSEINFGKMNTHEVEVLVYSISNREDFEVAVLNAFGLI